MPQPDRSRSGCAATAGIALVIVVLAVLGYYFIWRVDSTGYTPGAAQDCIESGRQPSDCTGETPKAPSR